MSLVIDGAEDWDNIVDIETSRFEGAARPLNSTEGHISSTVTSSWSSCSSFDSSRFASGSVIKESDPVFSRFGRRLGVWSMILI